MVSEESDGVNERVAPKVAPRVFGATMVTLAGGTLMVGGQPVQAAAFTVDNLNNSGSGSLRQAITDANNAGAGPRTITFDAGLSGTITLASALPNITQSMTIIGPGSDAVTIDANGACDPIEVSGVAGLALDISGLTITNADCDGIDVTSTGGSVTLTDVTVTNSYDDGIEVDGLSTLSITDSVSSYNGTDDGEAITLGSGLDATGVSAVSISASSFIQNVYVGIEIDQATAVTITDSTANANGFVVTFDYYSFEYGAGVDLSNISAATISNSTVNSNYDDGIDLYNVSAATISGSTVSSNGDEGVEFDSDATPSTSVSITNTTVTSNGDNGIDGDDADLVTITGVTVDSNEDDGINLGDSATLTVATSTVSNNGDEGIELDNVLATTVTGVTVSGNGREGLEVDGTYDYPNGFVAVDSVTIVDSTFSNNDENGFDIADALSVTLTDVTSDSNGEYGGVVDGGNFRTEVTVSGWSSTENGSSGLYVSYAESVSVTDSSFNGDDNEGLEIYNVTGDVTVSGVTVTDVSGGPLYVTNVGGSVTVESSSFTGGFDQVYLYNIAGDLTLRDVEVSGTLDDDGIKIIDVRGETLLERVTVSDVTDDGVDVGAVSMTVLNSTITGAGESGIDVGVEVQDVAVPEVGPAIPAERIGVGSTIVVRHSTITGNAEYGIGADASDEVYVDFEITETFFAATTITVDHSIVSGNGYPDVINLSEDNDAPDQGSTTVSWSLVDEGSDHAGSSNIEADDPMLGDLADNGGETLTMVPLSGSPAVSAGNPSVSGQPTTDQRGVARVRNRIEIGAVEVDAHQGVLTIQVPSTAGEAVGIPVTVTRTGGSDGPVSVTLRSSCDGTERTVSWADGETAPKSVTFPLPNNASDDPDRVCTISIVGSTNGDPGSVASFAVTVLDPEDVISPTLPPTGGSAGLFASFAAAFLAMGAAMTRFGRRRTA